MIKQPETITPTGEALTVAQYAGLQVDGPALYHISLERYSPDFAWHPTAWQQSRISSAADAVLGRHVGTGAEYLFRVYFEGDPAALKCERLANEAGGDQAWSQDGTIATTVDSTVSPTLFHPGGMLYCFYYDGTDIKMRAAEIITSSLVWATAETVDTLANVEYLAAVVARSGSPSPYLHVVTRDQVDPHRTKLHYYYYDSGWVKTTHSGMWPYSFTGFSAVNCSTNTDLLVIATDLPPIIGLKGEGTAAVSVGYRRQGLVGVLQSNSGWSEPFEIDVLDRARSGYAFRSGPKVFKDTDTGCYYIVALAGDGNRWDMVRFGEYDADDHLQYLANLLYTSPDGIHWSQGMAINAQELDPNLAIVEPMFNPLLVVNSPYAYLLSGKYLKRAHATRLLTDTPSSAIVRNVYGDASVLQKSMGSMAQTALQLEDEDDAISGGFLMQPGQHMARVFLGKYVSGTPAYSLVSTELVDAVRKQRVEGGAKTVSVTSRDFTSLLTDRVRAFGAEERDGQIIGVDSFDDLSHIAAYAGTWDINSNGLFHEGDTERGGAYLAWTGVSEVESFDLALIFKLSETETKFQCAGVVFRSHQEITGKETCYELRYTWVPDSSYFGVDLTDNLETLSDSMQAGGELYIANGSAVPAVGDYFRVGGSADFIDDDLLAAKGTAPIAWDMFMVTNNTLGEEAVIFVGNYDDHDDLALYKIENGAYTKLATIQGSVPDWPHTSGNHLYVRVAGGVLSACYKHYGITTWVAAASTYTFPGMGVTLSGPEDNVSIAPLLAGFVGLSAFGASDIEFWSCRFVDHNSPLTVEDSIRLAAAYAGFTKFTFDNTLMEFPDADGNYDLNEFNGSVPEASTGTWSVSSSRLRGVGGGAAQWYYRWYDHKLPPNFKLSLRKVGTRGRILFKSDGTGGGDTYYGFEWTSTHVATIKNGVDQVRYPIALPSTCDLTVAVREVKMDLTTDNPEWMHLSVFADGKLVLAKNEDISGGFPPLYLAFGVYESDTAYFYNMRVPELTEFVETMTIDTAQPPMSALSRILPGRPVEMCTRFDGSLRVWLPKARTVDVSFDDDDVFDFEAGYDFRALPTHVRALGAYKELDMHETNLIRDGWPHRFEVFSNPNAISSDDLYGDLHNMTLLLRENAETGSSLVRGNPFLETGDRVTIEDENDWFITSMTLEAEPATFRQRLQLRRYDARRDS